MIQPAALIADSIADQPWEKCSRSVIWKYSGVPKPGTEII